MKYLLRPKTFAQRSKILKVNKATRDKLMETGRYDEIGVDDSPTEFAHPKPILPEEAKKPARKGTTEATPEPVTKKGKHGA